MCVCMLEYIIDLYELSDTVVVYLRNHCAHTDNTTLSSSHNKSKLSSHNSIEPYNSFFIYNHKKNEEKRKKNR